MKMLATFITRFMSGFGLGAFITLVLSVHTLDAQQGALYTNQIIAYTVMFVALICLYLLLCYVKDGILHSLERKYAIYEDEEEYVAPQQLRIASPSRVVTSHLHYVQELEVLTRPER